MQADTREMGTLSKGGQATKHETGILEKEIDYSIATCLEILALNVRIFLISYADTHVDRCIFVE